MVAGWRGGSVEMGVPPARVERACSCLSSMSCCAAMSRVSQRGLSLLVLMTQGYAAVDPWWRTL